MTGEERLAIWRRAQAVLGKKAPAMLRHVENGRREWEERMGGLEKLWKKLRKKESRKGV
ncbi:MAG: hypothetical protein UY50_C0022G0007 [Parcubacteria group bacterium GW2011_GWA2_49_9]|nr:MAG: hypothetical protein UY50_C0022G0007 [Parcubacteria group bacterium GW2011_GWA2_49_9]